MSLDAFQRPEDNRGLKNYKTPEIAADSYSLAVTGADVLSAVDILFRPRRDLRFAVENRLQQRAVL